MTEASAGDKTVNDLLAGLPLHRHKLEIAGRSWLIDAIANQELLLAVSDRFQEFPYGMLLWESAPVLGTVLAERGSLSGKHVLELGAGVGLVGLIARHLGGEVSQTDHAREVLMIAAKNARLNGIMGIRQFNADWQDWTNNDISEPYDVIVGSDILYDGSAHEPIANVLAASLAQNGIAILTDPGRTATPFFIRTMRNKGWCIHEQKRRIAALVPSHVNELLTISVLTISRN